MSTENELTPGGPTRLHTLAYSELATTLQLNTVSLLGKAVTYGEFYLSNFTFLLVKILKGNHISFCVNTSSSSLENFPSFFNSAVKHVS